MQAPKKHLVYLIDPRFHELNSLFVISFENNIFKTVHTRYFPPTIEKQKFNIMIDGRNFLN